MRVHADCTAARRQALEQQMLRKQWSPNAVGDKIIIEKSTNPFEKLGRLLGDISFDRQLCIEAEREALRSIMERLDNHVKEMSPRNGLSTGAHP